MLAPFTPPPTTTTSAVWIIGISPSPGVPPHHQDFPLTLPSPPVGERETMLGLGHHVPWIEGVSQSVPEEIEARHREGDRDPGEDGHPRRRGEIALRVVEHVTPARERRLDPVAEIADVG